MTSNPTITNRKSTFDDNSNSDYVARTTEVALGQIQHVRNDPGVGDEAEGTIRRVVIDQASSGDNELIAAAPGKKFRILSCFLVAAGSVTTRFESAAGGTALTGQMELSANGGFVLNHNPLGWFETIAGEALNLELSGATSVDGALVALEITA